MKTVSIVFPHQLFLKSPLFKTSDTLILIEEHLFFSHYKFHKQKIAFHRASMKKYEAFLNSKGLNTHYINAFDNLSDIRILISDLASKKCQQVFYIDPTDYWLSKRLKDAARKNKVEVMEFENPLFLNDRDQLSEFFKPEKKKFFQTVFYKGERIKRNILLESNGNPAGGKWTFDSENRKKYPKGKNVPKVKLVGTDKYYLEAKEFVEKYFSTNPGELQQTVLYATDHRSAKKSLNDFLDKRFEEFGPYEDAIVKEESILHHSVMTPMLNSGLISPEDLISESLKYATQHHVPLNSTEGFIRQIIGWREFIRGVYQVKGREERIRNFWGFKKKMPKAFYDGSTGIEPVDDTINKVLKTAYCHHIERLMILGNFMLLCEIDPDEVYRWFMELFIDAYDWVMVPNVYGMSQFADGGLMSTKPYISGSNYIIKMSNYKKGKWSEIWDALFWRFMHRHRDFFLQNPRLSMLIRTFDKMDSKKRAAHLELAEDYLRELQ